MRHRKASIKFNRTSSHRDGMFRNMVTSLFKYKRIRTTDVKAKVVSRWADHLITLAKKGDLHSRRQALSIVREKKVVHQLFEEANDQYSDRPGGHTRIIKIGHRAGDAALLSMIELIGKPKKDEKEPKKKKTETDKKEEIKEDKKTPADKEKSEKKKKVVEPKKKEAGKKKSAPKKSVAEKKVKKTSSEEKKDKAPGKKKAVQAKKKAAPKKVKEKKEK
jgi:large subunit ribosomal protein L17